MSETQILWDALNQVWVRCLLDMMGRHQELGHSGGYLGCLELPCSETMVVLETTRRIAAEHRP